MSKQRVFLRARHRLWVCVLFVFLALGWSLAAVGQEPPPAQSEALPRFAVARLGSDRFFATPLNAVYVDQCIAYAGYWNGLLRQWDTCKRELLWETRHGRSDVLVYLSGDHKALVSVSDNKYAKIWDTTTRSVRAEFQIPSWSKPHLNITPSGIFTVSADRLSSWSLDDGRLISEYVLPKRLSGYHALTPHADLDSLSPDQAQVVWVESVPSGTRVRVAPVNDLSGAQTLIELPDPSVWPHALKFSPDSKFLVMVSVQYLNHEKGTTQYAPNAPSDAYQDPLTPALTAHIWPLGAHSEPRTFHQSFPTHEDRALDCSKSADVAFSEDGARVKIQGIFFTRDLSEDIEPSEHGSLNLELDLASGQITHPLPQTRWITPSASPDFFSTSKDIPKLEQPGVLENTGIIGALWTTPDGLHLLSQHAPSRPYGPDGALVLWSLPEGTPTHKILGAKLPYADPSSADIALATNAASIILTQYAQLPSPPGEDCSDKYTFDSKAPEATSGALYMQKFSDMTTRTVLSDPLLLIQSPIPDPDGEHAWVCHTRLATYEASCGHEQGDYAYVLERVHLQTGKTTSTRTPLTTCPTVRTLSLQSQRALVCRTRDTLPTDDFLYTSATCSSCVSYALAQAVDLSTGKILFETDDYVDTRTLTLSPSGAYAAFTETDDKNPTPATVIVNIDDKSKITIDGPKPHLMQFSADSRALVFVRETQIFVLDLQHPDRAPILLEGHNQGVVSLAISATNRLFSAQHDGLIYAWDLNAALASAQTPTRP